MAAMNPSILVAFRTWRGARQAPQGRVYTPDGIWDKLEQANILKSAISRRWKKLIIMVSLLEAYWQTEKAGLL